MTTQWLLLLLVVVLLAASAFFVAAEFALIAARRSVIEPVAVNSARARSTLKAMEHVSLMMACAQLGITLCGVLLGALGEPAVAALLEPVFHALGVPEAWLHPVSLVIALLLVLSQPLMAIAKAIGPIIRALNHFSNAVVKLTGREPKDEISSSFTREEVADLVAESRREGLIDNDEHQRITSALDFDTTVVSAVMVPDAEVVSVTPGVTPAEIERICGKTGFSRFPIIEQDGRFSGYLHIRDVIDIPAEQRDQPVPAEKIRPLPTVVPGTDLRTALDRMRRIGAHLAEVADAVDGREPVTGGSGTEQPGAEPPGPDQAMLEGDIAEITPAALQPLPTLPTALPARSAPSARGVVMLEDVIEALIGEIRDAT